MILLLLSILSWYILLKNSVYSVNTPRRIRGGGGGASSQTYYNYSLLLTYQSIDPAYPILIYDAYGNYVYTVQPYDTNMNYGTGIYTVPGSSQNTTIESVSTATFYVVYPKNDVTIDYDNSVF